MVLEKIGADERVRDLFRLQAAAGTELGRISFASHEQYRVLLETAECDAVPAGRLRWADALPAVGDWVSARRVDAQLTLIEAVLPRRTQFSRRAAGRTVTEQVVAANIDLAVIVTGLDGDFNPRRMERYLVLAREGGAEPVIVLNKADVCDSVPEAVDAVTRIANGAQVLVLRARESVEVLKEIVRGRTVAFLGSSGAGKSTIANGLLGEERQPTGDVRAADSRGRHTTASRMLIALPEGGIIIDNPGMRELQLWASEEALDETFGDISAFAQRCRFGDCSHSREPGCAVQEGLERGDIETARWDSYRKLQKQLRHQVLEQDLAAKKKEKNRWKTIEKSLRKHPKYQR